MSYLTEDQMFFTRPEDNALLLCQELSEKSCLSHSGD
jgi:hypothetical protein